MKDQTIGNFRVIEMIGSGGMGEVWIGEQKDLGTRVAIKILQGQISRDQNHITRFFNEARAVSKIPHAGIAKISDAGFTATGRAYLVMELLDGETLTSLIRRQKRLSLAQITEIGSQIASVLAATHKQGITHRDLKPDNIFLVVDAERASGQRVKVLDFGIAKLSGTLARQSPNTVGAMGTPSYMAPEQWGNAATVDWRADLYSLGCVIFEMACGRPPFVGEHFPDLFAKHTSATPPKVSEHAPGMPKQLDALVARLLAKQPDERGGTMKDVERELAQLGEGAEALAPPELDASTSQGEVAPTMPPDQLTVAATPPQIAATMPADQLTVASPPPVEPEPEPEPVSRKPVVRAPTPTPAPAPRSGPALAPAPTHARSRLPLVIAGVVLAGGAGVAIFAATRGGNTDAQPSDAALAVAPAAPADPAAGSAAVVSAPDDAADTELATCMTAALRVAGFVKATDALRPAAQGAVSTVVSAHCVSDRWPIATIGCVAGAAGMPATLACLEPLGKDKFDKLGADLELEAARKQAGWVQLTRTGLTLIEPIGLAGDDVREESRPLVAAVARVLLQTHQKIEIAGGPSGAAAVRNLLVRLGVPGDQLKEVAGEGEGVELRLPRTRLDQLKPGGAAPTPTPSTRPAVVHGASIQILDRAHFASGTSALDAAGQAFVATVAGVLKGNPAINIEIEGHIDSSEARGLGLTRARTVATGLIAAGIAKARVAARGFGAERPIATNRTEEGRAANRRVEIHVVP